MIEQLNIEIPDNIVRKGEFCYKKWMFKHLRDHIKPFQKGCSIAFVDKKTINLQGLANNFRIIKLHYFWNIYYDWKFNEPGEYIIIVSW